MRTSSLRILLPVLTLASCSGGPPEVVAPPPSGDGAMAQAPSPATSAPAAAATAAAPAPTSIELDADSPLVTPSGATYTGPKGWTVTTKGGVVLLEDPKGEVSLTFVERNEAEGKAAIAAAWSQVKPGFARSIKLVTSPPGRRGWDAVTNIDYETTTAEARGVWAEARRKGDTWYVTLFDGTNDGWGRRVAGARIAQQSFKAKGVEEESFRGKKANVLDEARLKQLEAFIEEGQSAAKIPGLAVAIVQGGKVVYEKGFGVRELGKKDKVTPNTLFRIASMTKPLTSLMMAALADEGKFGWDTPVAQVLPSFALGDPELTKRVTMKTVLCACTGIPYDNVGTVFESAGVTPEKALARLVEVKPTTGFGETFQYSNAMIAVGGYVAAHALFPKKPLEAAYQEALKVKILDPLGMTSTRFDLRGVLRAEHASAHDRNAKFEHEVTELSGSEWIAPLNPGGGAWSTVRDIAQVIRMELARGKTPDGKQVISEPNLMKRREPQGRSGAQTSYGLALGIETYRGVQVFGHNGGLSGFASAMFFVPDHDVGAVILSNSGPPSPLVYGAFRRKIFELLFDLRDEAREDAAFAWKTSAEELAKEMSRIDFEPDLDWLKRFAGTYAHPTYGKLTIKIDGKRGILDAGEWSSPIGRKKEEDGTLKVVTTGAPWVGWPELIPKESNGVISLLLEDGQRKVLFEKAK